ncbi:MAG TPA: DUF6789 family protein [Polyangia bacterium]|nr:DUF6789 family protein [Polyangia bacterium]
MAEVDVMTHERRRLILEGGAVAGLVGGAVVSLLVAVASALQGQDVWRGLKIAAYPFLGDRVLLAGLDVAPVALGLLAHLVVAAIWGVLFAAVAFGLSRWATVGFGAVWGFVVLFVMVYLVLPAAGAARLEDAMVVRPVVLEHVTFGLAVGLAFLPFQRRESHLHDRWLPRAV